MRWVEKHAVGTLEHGGGFASRKRHESNCLKTVDTATLGCKTETEKKRKKMLMKLDEIK